MYATSDIQGRSLEQRGFTALVGLLLAPVLAQGLWLPLAHFLGPEGDAARLGAAALAIAAVVATVPLLGRSRKRPWLGYLLGGLVAAVAASALSLGLAGFVALLAVAAAIGWLVAWLPARLPAALDGLAQRHRRLAALYLLCALLALVSTSRLSTFMGDPSRADMQALPGDEFVETHSCLTAYVRAYELVQAGVDDVYDDRWWAGSNGLPPLPAGVENPHRPFELDNFSYPPPFLLFVAPLAPWTGDFFAQRALWFGLHAVFVALGLFIVARWIDGAAAHRALLLTPLAFGSVPILVTLQIGNFQLATLVLSVLAMVAFERKRLALGGALLALAILAKISPGVLGIVLLGQRRYREVAATAGFGLLLLAVSMLWFGTAPASAFVSHALPKLGSGAAFPFMATQSGILTNMSPFGFPFKLEFLGLDVGDPWRLGPPIARVYAVLLVLLALVAARRGGDRRTQAVGWMSLLVLGTLQSPFAPAYAALGLVWATTLLAVDVRRPREGIALVLILLLVLVVPPGLDPAIWAVQSMLQTALLVGVSIWLIVRKRR